MAFKNTLFSLFPSASHDELFDQLAEVNRKHQQLKQQWQDAEKDHECMKELEGELEHAQKARQLVEEEQDWVKADTVESSEWDPGSWSKEALQVKKWG